MCIWEIILSNKYIKIQLQFKYSTCHKTGRIKIKPRVPEGKRTVFRDARYFGMHGISGTHITNILASNGYFGWGVFQITFNYTIPFNL